MIDQLATLAAIFAPLIIFFWWVQKDAERAMEGKRVKVRRRTDELREP